MDRSIQKITNQLISRLPEGESYYRIQKLKEYDFPPFLIRRMHIELEWKLDELLRMPATDWANTQAESVQESWQQFMSAMYDEVHLPAGDARNMIETAVTDVVQILVQPRKNIPEILFGEAQILSKEELSDRTELLVVYPHFASVLIGYMERKNHEQLSKKRCKAIVAQVDAKITNQYKPLQWAQTLDPLFELNSNAIESTMLALFFEDKKMPKIARRFDLMDDRISRTEFIEVLSSDDLLNDEAREPHQSKQSSDRKDIVVNLAEEQEIVGRSAAESDANSTEPEAEIRTTEKSDTFEEADAFSEEDIRKGKMQTQENDLPAESYGNSNEAGDTEGESPSLNEIYLGGETDYAYKQSAPEVQEENASINQQTEVKELEEEEESPIWQRFMALDDEEENQTVETEYEDDYLDEPFANLTENKDSGDIKEENIRQLLQENKHDYVEELFGGSERAYQQALQKIAKENDWKWASKLIEKHIFKLHMVNIYTETAVDFTDRLQTYFLEKQNHNL